MLHPHTELRFINKEIGYGVVATRLIPRGTITWVRCQLDRTITPAQAASMPPIYQAILDKYAFTDGRGDLVLCWDLARFINHSCEATCLAPGYEFEVAVRDIHPGEELTDDYGALNLDFSFTCHCGSPVCRRTVRPDDMLRQADTWDTRIREVFPLISGVEQPLWDVVTAADKERVARAQRREIPVASCRLNFFAPKAGAEAQAQAG
ncbi:MAG: SET domain-containing protein [Myxococcota bacterium]